MFGLHTPDLVDWDADNEARHIAKHGIAFDLAVAVFTDPRRIEAEDLRPNKRQERRWNVVGIVDGVHLNVTFAIAGRVTTIISARPAHRKERTRYGAS